MKRVKKNLRYYKELVKQLEERVKTQEELLGLNRADLTRVTRQFDEYKAKSRTMSGECFAKEIARSIEAQAHALEALVKLAQPGVF